MTQYGLHPSTRLRELFENLEYPYQGRDPKKAKVIIVGIDANYPPEINEDNPFLERIVEYHHDGIAFWNKHKVHHPFILDEYPFNKTTGGVPYHRRFGWMGLPPEYAEYISFIELLDVPTTGRTERKVFWDLFNVEHGKRLDQLIYECAPRLVLLSKSLTNNYMRKAQKKWGVFSWLPDQFTLGEMKKIQDTVIYGAPHFSSTTYTKTVFQELGAVIRNFCER